MIEQPLTLAVETSGRIGSVALGAGGELLAETCFSGPMRHSSEIFPAAAGLLEGDGAGPADIGSVYVSVGPGSFTGLRIAVALAKTMALANGAKIVAVNTMDVIASIIKTYVNDTGAKVPGFATILDAKRGQFFVAAYKAAGAEGGYEKCVEDCLMSSEAFLDRFGGKGPIWVLGEGLLYHREAFAAENIRIVEEEYWRPRAGKVYEIGWAMAQRGEFADPLSLVPNYLLRPEAEVKRR